MLHIVSLMASTLFFWTYETRPAGHLAVREVHDVVTKQSTIAGRHFVGCAVHVCWNVEATATHCNTLQHTATHCNTHSVLNTSGCMNKACVCSNNRQTGLANSMCVHMHAFYTYIYTYIQFIHTYNHQPVQFHIQSCMV